MLIQNYITPIGALASQIPFDVKNLFTSGENGAVFDISGPTVLKEMGSVASTANHADPIAMMLDTKKAYSFGAPFTPIGWANNPSSGFDTFTNLGAGAFSASKVSVGGNQYCNSTTTRSVVLGQWYRVTVDLGSCSVSDFNILMASGTNSRSTYFTLVNTGPGVYTGYFRADVNSSSYTVAVYTTSLGTIAVNSISVSTADGANNCYNAILNQRPLLMIPPRTVDFDGINDTLTAYFMSSLGSSATIGRSFNGVGANILTGQTVGTTYTFNTDLCGLVIVNRSLTITETTGLVSYLNSLAGV